MPEAAKTRTGRPTRHDASEGKEQELGKGSWVRCVSVLPRGFSGRQAGIGGGGHCLEIRLQRMMRVSTKRAEIGSCLEVEGGVSTVGQEGQVCVPG